GEGIGLGLRQPEGARDLREVRVRSRADEELELLVAGLVPFLASEPWALAVAAVLLHGRVAHALLGFAAHALDLDPAKITRGAFAKLELGAPADTPVAIAMSEVVPGEVREVTTLARSDEA